jgi:hypothetical protein
MPKNKAQKGPGKATLAGVKKEMAKPRVANSALKKYIRLALKGPRGFLSGCFDQGQNQSGREVVEMAFEGRDFQQLVIRIGGTIRGA